MSDFIEMYKIMRELSLLLTVEDSKTRGHVLKKKVETSGATISLTR